jgi:hypothetical protein
MTTIDDGKQLYTSHADAEKVAAKMSRTHNEGFNVYKVGNQWAIGGVHLKTAQMKPKVKSLSDIRALLDEFREFEQDTSVEDYIAEIERDSQNKESLIQGGPDEWILKSISVRLGNEIGMSLSNNKEYLVLSLEKETQKLTLKMGGNFSRHIPLIKRQAESLIDSAVIWHTWNNNGSNWGSDSWFYRIEKK